MSVVSNNILAGASGQGGATDYAIQRSLRFNSGDSAYLSRQPSSASNRKTWTWSCWIKRNNLSSAQNIFVGSDNPTKNNTTFSAFYFHPDNNIHFGGWNSPYIITNAVYRDASAWYHIVLSVDTTQSTSTDRIKVYVNNELQSYSTGAGFPGQDTDLGINQAYPHYIGGNDPASGYASHMYADVHFIDGQALAPTDFGETDDNGVWQPIEYAGTYGTNGFHLPFSDNSSNAALGTDTSGNNNNFTVSNLSIGGRDYLAEGTVSGTFYTSVGGGVDKMFDGSPSSGSFSQSGTASFTFGGAAVVGSTSIKIRAFKGDGSGANVLVNGTDISSLLNAQSSGGYSTVNVTSTLGGAPVTLASVAVVNAGGGSGNIAQIIVDDVVLTIGSPAGNDSLVDAPTNGTQTDTGAGGEVVGNYATFNSLAANQSAGGITISNGNLDITRSGGSNYFFDTTMSFSSGKWYWEMTVGSTISSYPRIGIWNRSSNNDGYPVGADHRGWGAIGIAYSTSDISNGLPTFGVNDILMFAMDLDNGKLWFGKNGTWYSTGTNTVTAANIANNTATARFTDLLTESTGATWTPIVHMNSGDSWVFNAGQRSFAYTAPSGYKCLNTANLPEPTIADGSQYFDTKLWTGNGGTQAITGLNFSPDFVWGKLRSGASAISHILYDAVRGAGSLKGINSDLTRAEGGCYDDASNHGYLDSFDANGFTVVDGNHTTNYLNSNNDPYVGWAWDAGSSNTTIAAGGLNSSVYDQSQTWSTTGTITGTPFTSNSTFANAFNGSLSGTYANNAAFAAASSSYRYTFAGSGISFSSASITGYQNFAGGLKINAGETDEITLELPANSVVNIAEVPFTLTSGVLKNFELTCTAATTGPLVYGVKIDGKLLVDSGLSVTNVPSIATTVRANPSAGFSCVKWTGVTWNGSNPQTIGHGLAEPEMIILKNIDRAVNWAVYHKSIGNTTMLQLNTTDGQQANDAGYWNNTTPTSSVFTVGNGYGYRTGGINEDFVAYCFAPVEGYSAMGSYTGNGSSDGPFVHTGFRPAFLLVKQSNAAQNWVIVDSERSPSNVVDKGLYADLGNAEQTSNRCDFLSNGFKIRINSGELNTNNGTYVYLAVAENPFKTARAR